MSNIVLHTIFSLFYLQAFCLFFLDSRVLDIKADERNTCTIPEMVAHVPQEIDPTKESSFLLTYSVHWEVRHVVASVTNTVCALHVLVCLINTALFFIAGEWSEMGVSLGHVPHHERRADPLVLNRQLCSRGILSVRWGWFSSSSSLAF